MPQQLAPNLNSAPIYPSSFDFYDEQGKIPHINQLNVYGTLSYFHFSTDQTGAITAWTFRLGSYDPDGIHYYQYDANYYFVPPNAQFRNEDAFTLASGSYVTNLGNQSIGTWSVPEPGILILLGISMMSVVGLRRWWKD